MEKTSSFYERNRKFKCFLFTESDVRLKFHFIDVIEQLGKLIRVSINFEVLSNYDLNKVIIQIKFIKSEYSTIVSDKFIFSF